MDQGSTRKRSAVHNFARAVTKFCVMWEGLSLPHDTKFGNCRGEIVDRRMIFIWSLIHGSGWSRLIKAEPGSQIPQVEVRKRCSRDLFTSSGRATALIGRHFWYTILQQSMTRLTNTVILLTYTSRFHWRFSGNWQKHIWECKIRCFGSVSHLSLGSDRLNVTVCRTRTVPLWDVQRTVRSWSYWKNILGWLALRSSSSLHLYSTVVFGITFWGEEGRMTVWLQKTSANDRESAHSISLMAALLRSTRAQRCLITKT